MFKKILLSSSLLLAGSVSSFADLNMSYDAYANSYIQDQATLARKAIGGDFLVDKFMPFFEIENAFKLFEEKYSTFSSEVGAFVSDAYTLPILNKDSFSSDMEGSLLSEVKLFTLIDHMRTYINDSTDTGLFNYLNSDIGYGQGTDPETGFRYGLINMVGLSGDFYGKTGDFTSELSTISFKDGTDSSLVASFTATANNISNIVEDIGLKLFNMGLEDPEDPAAVYPISRPTEDIYLVLNGTLPEQSIYSYLENKIGVLDNDVEALKARTNHILKILSRY